jgi:hypothetical protein
MANGLHEVPVSRTQAWPERSQAEYMEGDSLVEMIHADLIARRISIEGCRDIIHFLRDQDAPTYQRLAGILAAKGQRASDTANCAARIAVSRLAADLVRKNIRNK